MKSRSLNIPRAYPLETMLSLTVRESVAFAAVMLRRCKEAHDATPTKQELSLLFPAPPLSFSSISDRMGPHRQRDCGRRAS